MVEVRASREPGVAGRRAGEESVSKLRALESALRAPPAVRCPGDGVVVGRVTGRRQKRPEEDKALSREAAKSRRKTRGSVSPDGEKSTTRGQAPISWPETRATIKGLQPSSTGMVGDSVVMTGTTKP